MTNKKKTMKEQREKMQALEEKRQKTINTIIGGAIAIVVAGLVIWNQGFYQDSVSAMTVDGTGYSAAQVKLYYTDQLYGALTGSITPENATTTFDYTLSPDLQPLTEGGTETWHDFFVSECAKNLAKIHFYAKEAKANGFALPEDGLEQLNTSKSQFDTAWIGVTQSKSAYFDLQFGMSEAQYMEMLEMELLANFYQNHVYENYEFSSSEFEDYYGENPDSLDAITYSQFNFHTSLSTNYDEEGNVIEFTDEELENFDITRALANSTSGMLESDLADGLTPEEVAEKYEGQFSTMYLNERVQSSTFTSNDTYGTWLLEEREVGDFTKTTVESDTSVTYTVTIFHGRERAEDATATIRHIFLSATDPEAEDTTLPPTEEEWDACYAEAEEILKQWEADGADLDEFATLAQEISADTSSSANGGLVEHVNFFDGYAAEFLAWSIDDSRKIGDTEIVQNTESALQGWHIMYYEDSGLPYWELTTKYALSNAKFQEWSDEITELLDTSMTLDAGTKYIPASSLNFG